MARSIFFIICIALVISCKKEKPLPTSEHFNVISLSDGVYALINKFNGKAICNAGIIDLGDTTLVFDTFLSSVVAQEIPGIVKQLGLSPIHYVVNSHWHDDHIRGNQVFDADVKIISTKRTTELIATKEPENLAAQKQYAPLRFAYYDSLLKAFEGDTSSREYKKIMLWHPYFQVLAEENQLVKTRLPDIYVDQQMILNGSKRSLKLISRGAGHTESDLVLYLPVGKIIFSSDLVFTGRHPYLPDGNTDNLKEWMTWIRELGVTTVVPGHGPIGDAASLGLMTEYVNTLEMLADSLLQAGAPPDQFVLPRPFNQWWFERFAVWNMEFVYNAMKEKK